jgi:Serine dehydrogenase proteinase
MGREKRVELISRIEAERGCRLITYICSDRGNVPAQISDDAVRPMYAQVRKIGKVSKIDLFLYSRGGAVEVPWRIVTMLREYCSELGVLIPYRAHSAATMIALGCDHIVMGGKAELGPIDPALSRITQDSGTAVKEEIRVEDIMSYVDFLKEKAGLSDQAALAGNIRILGEKLTPWLGTIYRTHSHIRMVASKLLGCHAKQLDKKRVKAVIDALAQKTYSHGHAIGRNEAQNLGLPVSKPNQQLEDLMWQLMEEYEAVMEMLNPLDVKELLEPDLDEYTSSLVMGMIESITDNWSFRGKLKLQRLRQAPSQVNININLGFTPPPGMAPEMLPQEAINQLAQQVQRNVPQIVQEQVKKQSPTLKIEGGVQGGRWMNTTSENV